MGKNQWVSPKDGKWGVHGEGNDRYTKIFNTQKEAETYAKNIAKNQNSELIIQGKDGQIRSKDSFGNDSCPPKDTEH